MTRSEFLEHHWTAYPQVPRDQTGLFGRVVKCEGQKLMIRNQKGETWVEVDLSSVTHPVWGRAIPVNLLKPGDVIGFDPEHRCCYLLSPCLIEKESFRSPAPYDWSVFLERIDKFFKEAGFFHLYTPYLVSSPGVDHHIDFLTVVGSRSARRWYLPTSPEIHLKKFLCQGYDDIFEIKHCFRDDLEGPNHSVEFTMLEWYRSYVGLEAIEKDIRELFCELSKAPLSFEKISVAESFKKWASIELKPETTFSELKIFAQELAIETAPDDDWNDIFFRIFMERVEPNLGMNGPCFLYHFPPQQASLAQINSEGWCERFELYWKGIELANAYLEVNDPEENRRRFLYEQSLREKREAALSGFDQDFFDSLKKGMPPCSGVALGLDRLFKIISGL